MTRTAPAASGLPNAGPTGGSTGMAHTERPVLLQLRGQRDTAPATERPGTLPAPRPTVDLEVAIPAYNEASRLPETLRRTVDFLRDQSWSSRVVVVDNGSSDGTADVVRAFSAAADGTVPVEVVGCARPGKGAAVRRALLRSRSRFVGFFDADLATPVETLSTVMEHLEAGATAVVGSRHAPGARFVQHQPAARRLGGAAFRMVTGGFVSGVHDTQCGFKFFDRAALVPALVTCRTTGFAFDVELLRHLQDAGAEIVEIPRRVEPRGRVVVLSAARRDVRLPHRAAIAARGGRALVVIGNSELLRGSRVLVLNWRDVRHPLAGGAEQYMHEIGSRWVKAGAHVTWLTAAVPGRPEHERLDGIHILRAGGDLSVYPRTVARGRRARGHFDAVVDCQNGTPFFAPLFAGPRTPVVQLVHHVHQDQFATHFPAPVAALGRWLEGPAARRVYRDRPMAAVSPSTRHELRARLGFRGPIFVVPNGTVELPSERTRRVVHPTIALVSRLVPHKRIDLLLGHLSTVAEAIPGLRVDIVGDGPDRTRLQNLADELGMQATVTFHGRVSDEVRDELLSRAWLTTSTSQAEGWGCSVLEAAAWGVPCLALRVPGVRDSVLDGETGWLVDDPGQLGAALIGALRCLADPVQADQIAETCRAWAGCFSWDRSADLLAGVVRAEIARMAAVTNGRPVERRESRSDIAVLAVVPRRAPELFAQLRATDEVVQSRDRTAVVLNGCDETAGVSVMTRLGVQPISMQLMDNRLILAGPTAPLAPEWALDQLGLNSA